MIRLAKAYIELSNRIIEWCGTKISWLTVVLVLVICYDVIMRYLFNSSSVAIYELEWHIFALIFLLGAAYALKHDRHVRVDVLYCRFSRKSQAWINLFCTHIIFGPFLLDPDNTRNGFCIKFLAFIRIIPRSWRFVQPVI